MSFSNTVCRFYHIQLCRVSILTAPPALLGSFSFQLVYFTGLTPSLQAY